MLCSGFGLLEKQGLGRDQALGAAWVKEGTQLRGRRRPPILAVADGHFRRRNSEPLTALTTTTFDGRAMLRAVELRSVLTGIH